MRRLIKIISVLLALPPLVYAKDNPICEFDLYILTFIALFLIAALSAKVYLLLKELSRLKKVESDLRATNKELLDAGQTLQIAHKNIQDSIRFGSMIQCNILPPEELFGDVFEDYFTMWQPRDMVGGDIYLLDTLNDGAEAILMVVDCTGHGVPGAFVSMFVKAIERQIVGRISSAELPKSPAEILRRFNKISKSVLKQKEGDALFDVGFDCAVVYYDKMSKKVKFAGANIGLFYVANGKVEIVRGSRQSIGYRRSDKDYEFKEYLFDASAIDAFYIATDGYTDQIGGEDSLPFGHKRLASVIEKSYDKPMSEQAEIFSLTLLDYHKNELRNDDVTMVGFKVKRRTEEN